MEADGFNCNRQLMSVTLTVSLCLSMSKHYFYPHQREILKSPNKKKQHFCHHCGVAGHTRPNCYKWLATQQSNSIIASGNHNQFPSFFAPLGDLLKALMFLSSLNSFNSSPSLPNQGFAKRKDSSKVWKEKGSKWFCHFFFLSPSCFCFCITCVFFFHVLSQSSFMHCFV